MSKGFTNWKDATVAFRQHESSKCHKEAQEKLVTLPASSRDIGEMLSSSLAEEKAVAQHALLKILYSLQFLSRQGCAFRGHDDVEGNFYQLFNLLSKEDKRVGFIKRSITCKCKFTSVFHSLQSQQWLQKKRERYISHEVQNELIKLMALSVLRKIAGDLQATEFISVMIDECTDVQNKEQVILSLASYMHAC